jgi:spermidine/putrescine-binding protein
VIHSVRRPGFRYLGFEPTGTHYVPCTYGCTGISYNRDKVLSPVDSWQILFDETYSKRILMLDDMRECFGLAFRLDGHSLADRDEAQLAVALARLRRRKPMVLATTPTLPARPS